MLLFKKISAISVFCLVMLTSCKKEEQAANFETFAATYNGTLTSNGFSFTNGIQTLSKVDATTCNINGSFGSGPSSWNFSAVDYKVNSATSCDIWMYATGDTLEGDINATTLSYVYRYHTGQPDSIYCTFSGNRP